MKKTLAMRLLEGKKVPYEAIVYRATERDAVVVAQELGVSAAQLFKTLVVTRERGKPLLVMTPADRQLDLKKMAQAVGEKKLWMAGHAEAEELTGQQVGGISALLLVNKGFDIVLDASAQNYEEIYISAGEKGINLRVPVAGLVKITNADLYDVAAEN